MAVAKMKVGGNGGSRADGRGFTVEGAEAKVGGGEVGGFPVRYSEKCDNGVSASL